MFEGSGFTPAAYKLAGMYDPIPVERQIDQWMQNNLQPKMEQDWWRTLAVKSEAPQGADVEKAQGALNPQQLGALSALARPQGSQVFATGGGAGLPARGPMIQFSPNSLPEIAMKRRMMQLVYGPGAAR